MFVIIGELGTGKSTALRSFLKELNPDLKNSIASLLLLINNEWFLDLLDIESLSKEIFNFNKSKVYRNKEYIIE